MRSVVLTASLLTALSVGLPASVSAQEPEPAPPPEAPAPPPPPPPRDVAVPRVERVRPGDAQSRPEPRSPEVRVPEPARSENRMPARSADRVRETDADSSRREPAAATSPVGASSNDEQGGQRRGASRRPPSGGSSGGGGQAARDRAVPRTSAPRQDPDRVYVYPSGWNYNRYYSSYYYDPYYYGGGFGLGYLYYSPWGFTPAFYGDPYLYGYGGGYPGGRYTARGYDIGSVKLKVEPRDAEVYVDGYFAGHVDDFDGLWQSLKLDSGGYRIEIRKPGFETLHFDVRVQPDRNITFRGELKPAP